LPTSGHNPPKANTNRETYAGADAERANEPLIESEAAAAEEEEAEVQEEEEEEVEALVAGDASGSTCAGSMSGGCDGVLLSTGWGNIKGIWREHRTEEKD
jgi:hypothetical protein